MQLNDRREIRGLPDGTIKLLLLGRNDANDDVKELLKYFKAKRSSVLIRQNLQKKPLYFSEA